MGSVGCVFVEEKVVYPYPNSGVMINNYNLTFEYMPQCDLFEYVLEDVFITLHFLY